jgi:hypothetical protein
MAALLQHRGQISHAEVALILVADEGHFGLSRIGPWRRQT